METNKRDRGRMGEIDGGEYLTIQALLRLLVILVKEESSGDRRDGGASEERR